MKKNKLLFMLWIFIILVFPFPLLAYSSYIIPGGENVGIEVNSKGILVVGFYKVNDEYIAKESGFIIGDSIIKVNGKEVNNIDEMVKIVNENNNDQITYTVRRKEETIDIKLKRYVEDNILKSGMYVKDSIIGIGTLTFIDPNTKKFGALGHEILEKNTKEKFEIKDGKIFKSDVTGINKSENGTAGEKNARYDKDEINGEIKENTISGIFGNYIDKFPYDFTLKVATKDEVKEGKAKIRTVINNNDIKEYEINIIKINKDSKTKNILFEITDKELLEKTGGVIQGMSGSPIIQDNLIVGAVTHVIVNDTKKGYGVFITTMLEEADN